MATNGSGRRGSARTRPSPAAADTTPSTPTRRASRAATAEGTPDTSARRVLTILRYLAQHQRPVLASTIARDCHFPRSSTYRLLHVMEDERFVTYYPDEGRWGLGLSSYELGTGYLLSDPLARQSMSILVALAAQTGAFMAIGVLDGTDAIVSRAHHPESTTAWADFEPGLRYPAHLTAMGRALLIGRSRGDLIALYGDRPLSRPNDKGPGTVDELLEQLGRPRSGVTPSRRSTSPTGSGPSPRRSAARRGGSSPPSRPASSTSHRPVQRSTRRWLRC